MAKLYYFHLIGYIYINIYVNIINLIMLLDKLVRHLYIYHKLIRYILIKKVNVVSFSYIF